MSLLALSHPVLKLPNAGRNILLVVLLRSIFAGLTIYLLQSVIDFGTSTAALASGTTLGIILASYLAFTRLKFAGFALIGLVVYLISQIGFLILDNSPFSSQGSFFLPAVIENHLSLILIFLGVSATATWFFWRARSALTFEILIIFISSIQLLSGHRNFRFDSPRILNSLAWSLGVQQLTVLIILGAFVLTTTILYGFISSLPFRPLAKNHFVPIQNDSVRSPWFSIVATSGGAVIILILICMQIHGYYFAEVSSRTSNGVNIAKDKKEGMSPLDFHSALGSNNQPAGLIRLEGDYQGNPFTPMLYLRESALSQISGNELVVGDSIYDHDTSGTTPDQSYTGTEDPDLLYRQPVNQSIYLLTDHKLAFAVDYPISITQLKNPNPKRFKSTYRAYSMAPSFQLDSLAGLAVGDARWSEQVWQHYLEPHADPRYAALAKKLTDSVNCLPLPERSPLIILSNYDLTLLSSNLDKILYSTYNRSGALARGTTSCPAEAFAITQYLSKTAIYTLTPNHEVKDGEDPVAPFLFGDYRGYCVHFAHATVYMLRALGIPARIGTGYLTDLSQSRDGHILLRMSDRHAWAEIYVRGRGWLPFDTQPEQVESHADSQVDMKLLEELMGMLGPDEEILPTKGLENEPGYEEPSTNFKPKISYFLYLLLLLALVFIALKCFLRFGWIFTSSANNRLKRSYIAVASLIYDLGLGRNEGETRTEFRKRIHSEFGIETMSLVDHVIETHYSNNKSISKDSIDAARKRDIAKLTSVSLLKKFIMILNPSSVLTLVSGNRW